MPEPISVAILGSFPPLRGISAYCFELTNAIAAHVPVDFISFKHIYPEFLYPGGCQEDDSFPETVHNNLNIRRHLSWYNPISWIQEGLLTQADLLHAQWWSMPLAPIYAIVCLAFKIRRKPVIFTVHNVSGHEGSHIFETVSRILFKLGDHFIVHTEANRTALTTQYGIESSKVSVIPHGSLDFQVSRHTDRATIRQEMGLTASQKVILFFGAIRPYKGLATAIRAMADVVKVVPEACLLIAGKLWGPWDTYQKLIDELQLSNHVKTHLDYIPSEDVHRYFCVADLTVLPYLHFDSQSGVGSTAVAFRTPMIVSAVGGLPELVKNNRWVVPPGDSQVLAQTMSDCLSNPEELEKMVQQLDSVSSELDWRNIAGLTFRLYGDLINIKSSALSF